MKHIYKTKSVQERVNLISTLIDRYGCYDTPALLRGIETEEDWLKYPYVKFNTNLCHVNLAKHHYGEYDEIDTVWEFMDICGINTTISYEGLTIPKHRFI